MDRVGVREENEAVALFLQFVDDFPHRKIRGKNVFPCGYEFVRFERRIKDCERSLHKFLIFDFPGLIGIFDLY